ncbi:SNARE-binding exocyst subunit S6 [Malassezia sp. CBS 17886]|nr:SNARE-binding exocyst subunit S6 [Malassezia sp. CBS 17886]
MAAWNPPSAAGLLAEFLKSPDDMAKIASLRRKLTREHTALSAKLKIGAKDQLESTRGGLRQLQLTRRDIASVHEVFAQIETMFQEEEGIVPAHAPSKETRGTRSFRIISELSRVRRILDQTTGLLSRFESLPHEMQTLAGLIAQYQADLLGPAPDLLALHFTVARWETFRNKTLLLVAEGEAATQAQVMVLLEPLDRVLAAFETYLMMLCAHVLDLVRHQQQGVVVRLVKIIEQEGREDERTAAIRLVRRVSLEWSARFPREAAYEHTIKMYRHRFQDTVGLVVQQRLQAVWDATADAAPQRFYAQLDWLYADLELVRTAVVPLFPADFAVYRLYVQAYHRALGAVLQAHVSLSDAATSDLLELYQVGVAHETRLLDNANGVQRAWLEPSLLGGREKSIIDDYQALLTHKMDEWTAALMHDEISAFVAREKAPDENANGMYLLSSCVILFRMVNQQVDMAVQAGDAELLVRIVDHICVVLRNCQASWTQIVQQEFKKQTDAKRADEVSGGLVEYLIALANDQLASADQSEAVLHRLEPLVAPAYRARVRENVDNTLNGFLDISKHCIQLLLEIVMFDLRPAFKDLFTFPSWYTEGTTATVTETVRDYAGDYAARLEPNLFDVLSEDLSTRLLTAYLTALRRATRLRMPKAAERFLADANEFTNLITFLRSHEEAAAKVQVLHMIHAILSSSPTMVFLPYWTFAKAHGPNLAFLEALLRARDDMEKADVAALMDSARRKVKQEGMPDVPESGATIMNAVSQVQSGGLLGTGLLAGWAPAGPDGGIAWGALAQSAQNYLGAAAWRRDV